jgi:hypothetical protein
LTYILAQTLCKAVQKPICCTFSKAVHMVINSLFNSFVD